MIVPVSLCSSCNFLCYRVRQFFGLLHFEEMPQKGTKPKASCVSMPLQHVPFKTIGPLGLDRWILKFVDETNVLDRCP